jgi:clan AA aspartic protease (TIGR02281 family)
MGKFRFDATRGIILCKAELANKKESIFIKLVVDTGASFTMISIENALAIGINPSSARRHIEITTANGVIFAPIVRMPSFKCFGVQAKDIEIVCHNLPPESPVEGLLGLNFLRAAKVVINFSNSTIETK